MPRKPKEDKPAAPKKRGRKPREKKIVTQVEDVASEKPSETHSEKSSEKPLLAEPVITYNHLRYQRCVLPHQFVPARA